jgi:hypothetical protein
MDVSEQQDPEQAELLLNVFTPELHLDVYALERPVHRLNMEVDLQSLFGLHVT